MLFDKNIKYNDNVRRDENSLLTRSGGVDRGPIRHGKSNGIARKAKLFAEHFVFVTF